MKILVTGSSGLIGSNLTLMLESQGHKPYRLVREASAQARRNIFWDPEKDKIDGEQLEEFDAVVHLAGESIANGAWTAEQKKKIRGSRINSTKLLCKTLAGLKKPPAVLISASAIGYYGDRGSEELKEKSPVGMGFLANLCHEWEEATQPASAAGIRVVRLRIGIVLSPEGGALAKMLQPFKMGLGGPLGSGQQYMSWITMEDINGAILHAIRNDSLKGAVNAVSPNPVTNAEFTKVLGKVLGRPAFLPAPGFALKLALGEMAKELLLSSQRVVPDKLLVSGYEFNSTKLEPALRSILK